MSALKVVLDLLAEIGISCSRCEPASTVLLISTPEWSQRAEIYAIEPCLAEAASSLGFETIAISSDDGRRGVTVIDCAAPHLQQSPQVA
jgi:hypothetical protein